jgi:hypothetical protein
VPQHLKSKNIPIDKNILNIEPDDVEYIFSLAQSKGIEKEDIGSCYVMFVANEPMSAKDLGFSDAEDDEFYMYSEEEIINAEKVIPRSVYDPVRKRLIGINPTLEKILQQKR